MKRISDIVIQLLGTLLLTAAALKGWQWLAEPVANSDIWSYRPFLILTVEFELGLVIWLLSGLFKKRPAGGTDVSFLAFQRLRSTKPSLAAHPPGVSEQLSGIPGQRSECPFCQYRDVK